MARTQRTDPALMQIGDYIPCRYTAPTSGVVGSFSELGTTTAPLIPVASSATPDGSFNFIYVGDDFKRRKILIADRNIQHSISWDTLNTAGIASGSGLLINEQIRNITPVMTGNALPSPYVVSASSEYSALYGAWKAFNHINSIDADRWGTALTTSGWLKIDLSINKLLSGYGIRTPSPVGTDEQMPKSWTFEGSNNNSDWTILDTRVSETGWTLSQLRVYSLSTNVAYRYYRLNIASNNGAVLVGIGELEVYEPINFNTTVRLLTGGINSTDTDNEWNKYIANSTLNNTITPGDNAIWNWSGFYGTCSTTTTASTSRSEMGNTSVNTWTFNGGGSSYKGTDTGFRPVLIVESNETIKFLFQDSGDIKAYTTSWQVIGIAPVTDAMFINSGMLNLDAITNSILQELTSPRLLIQSPSAITNLALSVAKKPQLILANADIDLMYIQNVSFNITASQLGTGIVRIIASPDSGITWYTYQNDTWNVIDISNLDLISSNGIDPNQFNAISISAWSSLALVNSDNHNTIRFGYYLEMNASNDIASTDVLVGTFDLRGSWDMALPGTDYTYGYPLDNLMRVKLYNNGTYKITVADSY